MWQVIKKRISKKFLVETFDSGIVSHEDEEDFDVEPVRVNIKTHEQIFMVVYKKKDAFIEEHGTSSVVLSLFTTSAARALLFDAMETVVKTEGNITYWFLDNDLGCELFYSDTDSLIYSAPEGKNPLQTGNFLGEFTDEYPGAEIKEFYSTGPKQYLLTVLEKNGTMNSTLKIRGIS